MDKLKLTINYSTEITPQKVGDLFCSMDNNEMADFFNEIAINIKDWQHPFVFQMQGLTDTNHLSDGAREIMKQIGEYSSKTY